MAIDCDKQSMLSLLLIKRSQRRYYLQFVLASRNMNREISLRKFWMCRNLESEPPLRGHRHPVESADEKARDERI